MTSPFLMLCLVALLPTFQCIATPPLPTDPGIKIQLTPHALKLLGQKQLLDANDRFFVTESTYSAVFTFRGYDEKEFTTIPNDREPQSYADYHDVKEEQSDGHSHSKVVWEDKEFLEGEKIGGLQIGIKGLSYTANFTGEQQFVVSNSDVSYIFQVFVGQYDGALRLARVAAVVDASAATVVKDGEQIVDAEEKAKVQRKILECFVRSIVKSITLLTDEYPFVYSFAGDVILDFRLTEHPKFTDGVEIDFVYAELEHGNRAAGCDFNVGDFETFMGETRSAHRRMSLPRKIKKGKFVHDPEGLYTKKKVLHTLDSISIALKSFQFEEDFKLEGEVYYKIMILYDTDRAEHTTALRAEVSDEEEAARALQTFVRFTLSDELFNSAIDVLLIKKKMAHIKLDKDKLALLMTLYNQYVSSSDQFDPTTLPEDATLQFWMEPVERGEKNYQFIDGGTINQFTVGVRYAGKTAKYTLSTKFLAMFRGEKISRDIQKIIVDQVAEDGFPDLLTAEKLRRFVDDYILASDVHLFNPLVLRYFTESRFEDGHLTMGLNGQVLFEGVME